MNKWSISTPGKIFDRGCIAEDLYGNTKHTDLKIIPHFFNEGLSLTTAGIAIGYAQRLFNGHGTRLPPTILMLRLRRMNIANLFAIIQVFIDKGLIDIETIREILRIEGHFTQKHASRRRGKFYRYYAKWYVTDAIKYFTDDAIEKQMLLTNIVILNITAEHIGVSVKTLKYWNELEVEDIMVKPS
jgi:hypothetical protein